MSNELDELHINIKEDSKKEEFDRLKGKVQELFAHYEELSDDSL